MKLSLAHQKQCDINSSEANSIENGTKLVENGIWNFGRPTKNATADLNEFLFQLDLAQLKHNPFFY